MKFTAAVLFFSSLMPLAFSQETSSTPPNAGISIINPVLNSTAYTGTNYTITWTILDPNATTIEAVSLMNGSATNLNFVFPNMLTNGSIPVSDLSYNWTIPCDLVTAQDYVIGMRGNNSYMTYSSYFSIVSDTANCAPANNTTDATVVL